MSSLLYLCFIAMPFKVRRKRNYMRLTAASLLVVKVSLVGLVIWAVADKAKEEDGTDKGCRISCYKLTHS